MNFNPGKTLCFCAILLNLAIIKIEAQTIDVTVQQDPKFEQLLNEKRRINSSITIDDRYKIQVYNGDSESAKRALNEVRREFPQHDATVVFSTPAYKVWVGNFKSRIEAERNLAEISARYPNALLIRPNK
ncbi:MAG: SPOR domain-containing protein [Flavobacterium sp.]|nr:SPOR domain-containing protein [Flavobacterium sp.]